MSIFNFDSINYKQRSVLVQCHKKRVTETVLNKHMRELLFHWKFKCVHYRHIPCVFFPLRLFKRCCLRSTATYESAKSQTGNSTDYCLKKSSWFDVSFTVNSPN